MKPSIVKNDKNLKRLNRLIINNFYSGFIIDDKFELIRNHFRNNFRIIGILSDRSFEIKSDYKATMSIIRKILLIIFGISAIYFLIIQNWLILILFILFILFDFIYLKIKADKEIKNFTDRLLELDKFN